MKGLLIGAVLLTGCAVSGQLDPFRSSNEALLAEVRSQGASIQTIIQAINPILKERKEAEDRKKEKNG